MPARRGQNPATHHPARYHSRHWPVRPAPTRVVYVEKPVEYREYRFPDYSRSLSYDDRHRHSRHPDRHEKHRSSSYDDARHGGHQRGRDRDDRRRDEDRRHREKHDQERRHHENHTKMALSSGSSPSMMS